MKPGETKRKGPAIKTFDDTRARREAATFDWEDLTVWQQNAVLYGHRLMTELAASAFREAAGREGIRRFLPKMDVERKNNAVLIDGRRGSGKTIVLFTLLRYWIASRFKNILTADHRAEALVQAIDAALDPQRTQTSASEHGPLIVPIGPVDLQYLSPHTQIVPLIAGAFDEVVQGLRDIRGTTGERSPSWLASPADTASVADRWRDLVSSAAAWEVDSKDRQSRVDPEEYFLEAAEIEKHRSQLQAKFRLFADALCKEYTATTRAMETPLFVMCIDDADMKPLVSVRLLEALRVLYHPRVAFLLTGNSDLFVNMLTDSFFAGLRAPLRRLDLTGDTSDEMSDRSVALRLAREVYGKVIPTAHRVDVSRLSAAERYRILDDVVKRVGPRLDRTSREAISGVASNEYPLKWYFENDKYTLNALPEQLRDMWSLRDFVREEIERAEAMESRDNESSPDVIDHQVFPISTALKLWRDALADSLLPPPLAEMLRQVIRIETHPTFRFLVDNSRLEKNILSVPIRNYRHADGSTTTFRRIVGYEMWLEGRREAVLSPSAEGAVILASDLAADYADGGFVEHPLSPDEFDNPFVTVGLQSRVARGIVDVVWPMPDWDSFVDFHIFSDAWYEIAQQETAHRETSVSQSDLNHLITRLAKRFLRLVLDIIVDRKAGLLPEVRPLDSALDDWPRLAAEIANVAFTFKAANPTARDIINTRWARSRAALLVAPESRLEQQQAIAFGAALSHEFSHVGAAERHLLKDEIEIARGERLLRSYVHTGKESGVTISAVAQKELQTRDFPGTRVKRAHILDRLIAEIDSHSRDAAANWKNFIQTLGQ